MYSAQTQDEIGMEETSLVDLNELNVELRNEDAFKGSSRTVAGIKERCNFEEHCPSVDLDEWKWGSRSKSLKRSNLSVRPENEISLPFLALHSNNTQRAPNPIPDCQGQRDDKQEDLLQRKPENLDRVKLSKQPAKEISSSLSVPVPSNKTQLAPKPIPGQTHGPLSQKPAPEVKTNKGRKSDLDVPHEPTVPQLPQTPPIIVFSMGRGSPAVKDFNIPMEQHSSSFVPTHTPSVNTL